MEWLNMIDAKDSILKEIKETIEKMFSIRVMEHVEINKGLLNLKWKFKTDNGTLFIKEFNPERYPASKEQRLITALSFQMKLGKKGIRCPQILPFNGDVILSTKQNIRFIVTDYCEGSLINAGKINYDQAYDLGVELAKIHSIINNQIDVKANPTWVVPSKEQLIAKWDENWSLTKDTNTEDINSFLKLQREIFENIDINIFKSFKHGWAHSDLWCDNVLFHPDSLSAILDFDRLQYIYPELDISRAILSFALDDNNLRMDIVKAFIDGYNQKGNISIDDSISSLKLLYCLESFWWLRSDSFNKDGPPKRFAEEMIWLSVNWFNLEGMLRELRNNDISF
jgi:homoserine kinase type II